MVLVVCDSTPLIYLARLEQFCLLKQLHDAVLVPPAVWQEIAIAGSMLPEGKYLKDALTEGWVRLEKPRGQLPADEQLDPGEAEAIQLALEAGAVLAIDESYGRLVAQRLGLQLTGTVGLLIRARRRNLIPTLRPHLDLLRSKTNFRISDQIYRTALAAVGELEC